MGKRGTMMGKGEDEGRVCDGVEVGECTHGGNEGGWGGGGRVHM